MTLSHFAIPRWVVRRGLHTDHVADRDDREARSVGPTGRRLDRRRAGRSLAPAERVGAHHEVLLGVDGKSGADHALPPARGDVARTDLARHVAVARPGVADEDRVRRVVVERTPCLIGDDDLVESAAALERERAIARQGEELTATDRVAGAPCSRRGKGRPLDPLAVCHLTAVCHLNPRAPLVSIRREPGHFVAAGKPDRPHPTANSAADGTLGCPSQVAGPSARGFPRSGPLLMQSRKTIGRSADRPRIQHRF